MEQLFEKWIDEGKVSHSAYLNLIGESTEYNNLPDEDGRLKISVLISTYKRSAFLIRLLNSIKIQQYNNCEIIIVDDASSDDTGEVVKRYREENPDVSIIYLMNDHNSGASESRKKAYLLASGDIIIFADDDDYYIEPTYFFMLNQLYENRPDCSMTIAATLRHNERENTFGYYDLNIPEVLSNREYLNGFDGKYKLPDVFSVSMRSTFLKSIHYENLLCFNHTSLLLYGLLGNGKVYTINQAVGIYRIHNGNMTGNTTPGFIVANLESKEDIYHRAIEAGLLDNPEEWHYRNVTSTAGYHLIGNRKRTRENKLIWQWMREHLKKTDYYRFVIKTEGSRIRRRLSSISACVKRT